MKEGYDLRGSDLEHAKLSAPSIMINLRGVEPNALKPIPEPDGLEKEKYLRGNNGIIMQL